MGENYIEISIERRLTEEESKPNEELNKHLNNKTTIEFKPIRENNL